MSRIADDYGLDVWIWYPALDKDYGDPATVDFAVKEWGEVFKRLPRVDAVLVPGGDPGHTEPRHMFALLERQTASLRQFHPEGDDVAVAAGLHRGLDEPVLRPDGEAAGLADRARLRSAGARPAADAAREDRPALPDPPLPRHHAQPARAVPGARLGPRARADVEPRADQPAAARPDGDLPRARRARHRLHHLLRGLQRRRQQDRLEHPGLGPRRRTRWRRCASTAATSSATATPTASRRGCWRSSGTGAARSPATPAWTRRCSSSRRWSAPPRRATC